MAHLNPPVTERDHAQGPENAPVTLVEYGDYECPHCGHAYPIVKEIQEALGDQVRFVFRNFPLREMHAHAEHAAEAAEIAGEQGKYWEMHDVLFENQRALGDSNLKEYAAHLGLDVAALAEALADHTQEERVGEDFLSGVRSGVNGTPTFFINGKRHDDTFDRETLLSALQEAIAAGK